MARHCINHSFQTSESWDLRTWSLEHLLTALASGRPERSRRAALELLSRRNPAAAVPLVRWLLLSGTGDAGFMLSVAVWIQTLSAGEEKTAALGLIARLPDPAVQKVLLRSFQPKQPG